MEKLKIGRKKYNYRIPTDPSYENFTNIIVMIKDEKSKNEYKLLSPFHIKVPVKNFPNGVIHENYWQFLKVYKSLSKISVPLSVNNPKIAGGIRWCRAY